MTDRHEIDLTHRLPESVIAWLEGDTSPETTAALERWLTESPEHRLALDDFLEIWQLSRIRAASAALEEMHRRLDELDPSVRDVVPLRSKRRSQGVWHVVWRTAAILVIGLGLGLGWPYLRMVTTPVQYAQVVVPAGSQTSLELPGGIKVRLNYNTELAYHPRADVRDVYLKGEAFFTVPDGAVNNLRVHTEAGVVRDLGTEFNVHARDGRTTVTVTQGLVALETPVGSVELEAGQSSSATLGKEPTPPTAARMDAVTGWLSGRLTFYDEPLARVAQELEHRYGVPFEVDPQLRPVRINARIETGMTAQGALEAICISIQARCHWQGDKWRIGRE